MTKPFQRGLVVGKFAPLHRGHELVIRRAQEECEHVVLISYSKPEFPGCAPATRERWLAELFPTTRRLVVTDEMADVPPNEAGDATHRRFVGWLCATVLQVRVDAVFTSEDYGDGFARELTGYMREREPGAPEVRHVLVDRARALFPVSGSAIRADVHAHRQWLSPVVYASFVERVCLLGGESTGKSTLARGLGRAFATEFAPEYGRELWEAKAGALDFEDLRRIAEEQIAREERAARRANRFLFCDTSPLTTLLYSQTLFGLVDPVVEQHARRPYDHVLLCSPDFVFVQDGTRRDEAFRRWQHAWYEAELSHRRIAFTLVTGSLEERIAQVQRVLVRA